MSTAMCESGMSTNHTNPTNGFGLPEFPRTRGKAARGPAGPRRRWGRDTSPIVARAAHIGDISPVPGEAGAEAGCALRWRGELRSTQEAAEPPAKASVIRRLGVLNGRHAEALGVVATVNVVAGLSHGASPFAKASGDRPRLGEGNQVGCIIVRLIGVRGRTRAAHIGDISPCRGKPAKGNHGRYRNAADPKAGGGFGLCRSDLTRTQCDDGAGPRRPGRIRRSSEPRPPAREPPCRHAGCRRCRSRRSKRKRRP